jgi:AraC-like DNA-binding protein
MPGATASPSSSAPPPSTVSAVFVRSALQALGAAQRAAVLREAGITPAAAQAPDGRVPAAAFGTLWMAVAKLLDDEFFGLDARRMKVGSFAMLCHALAGERQLGAGLKAALRYFNLFFDDLSAQVRVAGGQAGIVLANRIAVDRPDARRFADETLLVMLHGVLCWLAGRRVPLARLDWGHPRPPHAEEYRRMFSPVLRFDAPTTAVWFDARLLQAEVQVDAASLRAFLRDAPQSVFLKQVASGGLSDRVRRQCRQALGQGEALPTLQQLAERLALSPATLRRRLETEGSTWQQLKDAVRRELSMQLLAERDLTVDEIADRLGFNDASTFYRAFRKWTGQAPGAWRAQAR